MDSSNIDWHQFVKDNLINEKGCLYLFALKKSSLDRKFPQFISLTKIIREKTSFLPAESHNIERIYCLYHGKGLIVCAACHKKKAEFKGFKVGYRNVCSHICYINYLHIVQEDGLTLVQRRTENIGPKVRAYNLQIGADGLSNAQRKARKGVIKRHKIDETGTSSEQRGKAKAVITMNKVGPDGLTLKQKTIQKMLVTKSIVGPDGLTIAQRTAIKVEKTKTMIGPDGLDSYQRHILNGFNKDCKIKKYNERLFYQGSYEKDFLDTLSRLDLLDFIKNGTCLKYIDIDRKRTYRTDFISNRIVFEIKSGWTYDYENISDSKGLVLRVRNNSKWLSTVKQGYTMIIVFDKKYIFELRESDFSDISKSLVKQEPLTDQKLTDYFKTNARA